MQQRLSIKKEVKFSYGAYNEVRGNFQAIRLSEGCPRNCPYCYEPQEEKIFKIPEIKRNRVKLFDMNFLSKEGVLKRITELGKKKVDNKRIYYDLWCGIDFRLLNQEIATALYKNRFGRFNKKGKWYRGMRMGWDWYMKDQYKMKDAIQLLKQAGYPSYSIMLFMICNWKIPYKECCKKLDLCKIWRVQVEDCFFDNQPKNKLIIPIFWKEEEIKDFKSRVRKHNQLVNFGIDPEIKS